MKRIAGVVRDTETILDRIVERKRLDLAATKRRTPLAHLRSMVARAPTVRPFVAALHGARISIIAELKKASPSRGVLRADFDPVALARQYAPGGASAISVVTEAPNFQGSLAYLAAVRQALPAGPPLLRKDFLFGVYQLFEARAHGADALLLIAAILETELLSDLIQTTLALGMAALVEVHDESEMERAVEAGATLIGINNRNLRSPTFDTDLATTERLRPLAPSEATIVAESGIFTREDMRRVERCGVNAVLIGEALVTADDPAAKMRELLS